MREGEKCTTSSPEVLDYVSEYTLLWGIKKNTWGRHGNLNPVVYSGSGRRRCDFFYVTDVKGAWVYGKARNLSKYKERHQYSLCNVVTKTPNATNI